MKTITKALKLATCTTIFATAIVSLGGKAFASEPVVNMAHDMADKYGAL